MEPALRGGDTCKEMFVNVKVPEDYFGVGWGKRTLSKISNTLKREFRALIPALRSTLYQSKLSVSQSSTAWELQRCLGGALQRQSSREEQVPTVPVGFGVWRQFYKRRRLGQDGSLPV